MRPRTWTPARWRAVRWTLRAAAAATATTLGLVASGAVLSPASADSPTKVGWWNFASSNGQSAPAPDANPGGMRVSVSSQQVLSFGAVEYSLPKDGSGTLTLAITQVSGNSSAPSLNVILACPTKDDNWRGGDNQDWSTAPAYSCDTHHFVGRMSSDGKSMSFNIDGSADVTDGLLSLAIVPQHTTGAPIVGTDTGTDMTPPYVVDFDKVGSDSFVSDSPNSSSSGGSSSGSLGSSSSGSGVGSGSGSTTAPPPVTGGGATISVPPATTTDPSTGQSPVVAGQQPTSTGSGNGFAPAAQQTAAKSNDHRDVLWVLLILVLFGILYTSQNAAPARGPKVLGPRAATATAGDGDAAALPMPYPMGAYPMGYVAPRGLGRFSKQRTGKARPLI